MKNAVIDGSHETIMSFLGCHEKSMYFHFKLEMKSPNCQIESLSLSVFGINILYWIVSDSLKYRPQAVLEKTKKIKIGRLKKSMLPSNELQI